MYTHTEVRKAKEGMLENSTDFLYMTKLQTDCIYYWSNPLVRKTSIHSECAREEKSIEEYKTQPIHGSSIISRSEDTKFSTVICPFLFSLFCEFASLAYGVSRSVALPQPCLPFTVSKLFTLGCDSTHTHPLISLKLWDINCWCHVSI